ncbi:uncharacterized protein LOC128238038 [Mya arenaria]|uniref:uncharacterized protein LOC128238038 n=1 Tax=Mya arenaria TaxID=6604 RepID=UPI0022DF15C6|nr:uncharacterized protein LOC128238038 [Mya arenaria]
MQSNNQVTSQSSSSWRGKSCKWILTAVLSLFLLALITCSKVSIMVLSKRLADRVNTTKESTVILFVMLEMMILIPNIVTLFRSIIKCYFRRDIPSPAKWEYFLAFAISLSESCGLTLFVFIWPRYITPSMCIALMGCITTPITMFYILAKVSDVIRVLLSVLVLAFTVCLTVFPEILNHTRIPGNGIAYFTLTAVFLLFAWMPQMQSKLLDGYVKKDETSENEEGNNQEDVHMTANEEGNNQEDILMTENEEGNNQEDILMTENEEGNNQEDVHRTENEEGNNQEDILMTENEEGNNQEDVHRTENEEGNNQEDVHRTENEEGNNQEDVHRTENEEGNNQEDILMTENEEGNNQEDVHRTENEEGNNQEDVHRTENEEGNNQEDILMTENEEGNNQEDVHRTENEEGNNQEDVHRTENEEGNNQEDVHRTERVKTSLWEMFFSIESFPIDKKQTTWKITLFMSFWKIVFVHLISMGIFYYTPPHGLRNYDSAFKLSLWKHLDRRQLLYFSSNIICSFLGYMLYFFANTVQLKFRWHAIPLCLSSLMSCVLLLPEVLGNYIFVDEGTNNFTKLNVYFTSGAAIVVTAIYVIDKLREEKENEKENLILREYQLFWIPTYNSVLLDQWLLLCERRPGTRKSNLAENAPVNHRPKVFICTTMYQESEEEMEQLLNSFKALNHKEKKEYDCEINIFFDDACGKENTFIDQLTKLVNNIFKKARIDENM